MDWDKTKKSIESMLNSSKYTEFMQIYGIISPSNTKIGLFLVLIWVLLLSFFYFLFQTKSIDSIRLIYIWTYQLVCCTIELFLWECLICTHKIGHLICFDEKKKWKFYKNVCEMVKLKRTKCQIVNKSRRTTFSMKLSTHKKNKKISTDVKLLNVKEHTHTKNKNTNTRTIANP